MCRDERAELLIGALYVGIGWDRWTAAGLIQWRWASLQCFHAHHLPLFEGFGVEAVRRVLRRSGHLPCSSPDARADELLEYRECLLCQYLRSYASCHYVATHLHRLQETVNASTRWLRRYRPVSITRARWTNAKTYRI